RSGVYRAHEIGVTNSPEPLWSPAYSPISYNLETLIHSCRCWQAPEVFSRHVSFTRALAAPKNIERGKYDQFYTEQDLTETRIASQRYGGVVRLLFANYIWPDYKYFSEQRQCRNWHHQSDASA